ncbi:cytochrome b/b6 domain-containing protein [Usitatibacter palustris]|uniref:cytochrome b/b6 domain-containing protein n=1 Tax=Usitatibacter palustris TaxID=2732487 RepID=UPI001BB16D9F|nr:cytochrome b/b6 domain-containing protein [Usitatibacter palustris]
MRVSVWDPLVRILHWTLAPAVLVGYATGDDGGKWHEALGYVALAAAAARILWGFIGSRHARFADFVPRPSRLTTYVRALTARREPRYVGHNPLGGAWIVLMLALVLVTGGTGWALSLLGEDNFEWLEDLHEGLAGTLLAAAAIHVAGVVWESLRHGENLVRSMFTGRKRAPGPGDR